MRPHHLTCLSLCVSVSIFSGCERPAPIESQSQPKVLFLGLDGATWKILGPLLEENELPAFQELVDQGAYMTDFETMNPTLSPVIWTTIATGRRPSDHGVEGFTTTLPNGTKIPATSSMRKAKAIWEIASSRGLKTGLVGWFATWPAEQFRGYVVTDHANPAYSELLVYDRNYWTADEKELARLERDYYPLEIGATLEKNWISKEDFPYSELQLLTGYSDTQIAELRSAPWNDRGTYPWIKTFFRVDRPLLRAGLDLLRERPTDLWMTYLHGPDAVQHYAWDMVEPQQYSRLLNDPARDSGLVEGVYRYLDSFLGEVLRARPNDAWLIVASDHGAEPSPDAHNPDLMKRPGEHSPAAKGVLFILGPSVKKGYRIRRANPYDLMPTLAWLLDLPLSEELPGTPLYEAFDDQLLRAKRPRVVSSYGQRTTGPMMQSSADDEILKSLRNLGYIQ